jgi:hypothetical protein
LLFFSAAPQRTAYSENTIPDGSTSKDWKIPSQMAAYLRIGKYHPRWQHISGLENTIPDGSTSKDWKIPS